MPVIDVIRVRCDRCYKHVEQQVLIHNRACSDPDDYIARLRCVGWTFRLDDKTQHIDLVLCPVCTRENGHA